MHYDKTLARPASFRMSARGQEIVAPVSGIKITSAQAACLNVTTRDLEPQIFVDAVFAYFKDKKAFRRHIQSAARQVRTGDLSPDEVRDRAHDFRCDLSQLPAEHLRHAYSIPPQFFAGPISSAGYIVRKLSRRADSRIVAIFEKELALCHELHGDALATLRSRFPAIYDALIRGCPRTAIERAVAAGKEAVALTRPAIANHLICLTVATAHLRLQFFKSTHVSPLTQGFAGRKTWLTMGEVSKAALIGPAIILQKLLALPLAGDLTDDEALAAVRAAGLFPDDQSSSMVIAIAQAARAKLPEHALATQRFRHEMQKILQATKPASLLKQQTLEDAGFTRMSFTKWRLNVSASEAAVILAMNLARARQQIDLCIDACIAGNALPRLPADPSSDGLSNNALARLAEALRIEGRADKNAPSAPGDRENRNAKQLVIQTRDRIKDGQVDVALRELTIDPASYFRK